MGRIVLHIDMDAFFASVEERDHPRLRGLPIVVGSDPAAGHGRGVVATANYAARAYGIKSAMPISQAWQRSEQAKKEGKPAVVFMGGSFSRYAQASREIFQYIATQGNAFEPASVDECYLEIRSKNEDVRIKEWEGAEKTARKIQAYIQKKFGLSCSIGVGPNKLISKIAAGIRKPHGLTVVRPDEVQKFLDPLPVSELAGVGPKTAAALVHIGVSTVRQLRRISEAQLLGMFGKHGTSMYQFARGEDASPVEAGGEAKSVGRHQTFDVDTRSAEEILSALHQLAEEIILDVVRLHVWFKTIAVTVRFSNFKTYSRSYTLARATQDPLTLLFHGTRLLLPYLDARQNPHGLKIRLVGLRAEKFVDDPGPEPSQSTAHQGRLF